MIARIYKQPARAYLFDRVIQGLQDALGELSWLNHIFGRSERLVKMIEGRKYFTPNVYRKNGEYISLVPDNTELGNYCFFVLSEPQQVSVPMGRQNRVKAPFSLIVWVDTRTIDLWEEKDTRNTEYLKEQLLKTIQRAWLRHGSVSVDRVYQTAENVFDGYTLDEVDNQFLMAPFAGFRLTGEMIIDEECDEV